MPNAYPPNNQIRLTASFSTLASTSLSAAVTSLVQTTLTVSSAVGFPAAGPYLVQVDAEVMTVTAGQGSTTWTVSRGVSPTVHDAGAAVTASVATAADPTAVTLAIKDPAGAKTAPSPVKDSVGNYHYDYTPTLPGQYGYAFAGTGAVVAQVEGTFFVTPSVVS